MEKKERNWCNCQLYYVRIISDKKMACSWALALSRVRAKAQLRTLIITI